MCSKPSTCAWCRVSCLVVPADRSTVPEPGPCTFPRSISVAKGGIPNVSRGTNRRGGMWPPRCLSTKKFSRARCSVPTPVNLSPAIRPESPPLGLVVSRARLIARWSPPKMVRATKPRARDAPPRRLLAAALADPRPKPPPTNPAHQPIPLATESKPTRTPLRAKSPPTRHQRLVPKEVTSWWESSSSRGEGFGFPRVCDGCAADVPARNGNNPLHPKPFPVCLVPAVFITRVPTETCGDVRSESESETAAS
mmetsp:Transcript_11408/g.42282  ORF Transcript_11408/g.42282 Transcript_11408/m.42282 type:complete len:252 (-) Transcript_11408:1474-2229(-)